MQKIIKFEPAEVEDMVKEYLLSHKIKEIDARKNLKISAYITTPGTGLLGLEITEDN